MVQNLFQHILTVASKCYYLVILLNCVFKAKSWRCHGQRCKSNFTSLHEWMEH